jgi:hypothetical protein
MKKARKYPQTNSTSKYKSGLEADVADDLKKRGIDFTYESEKVVYEIPTKEHKYTPDFFLPNGVIIETKGKFETVDRKKHLLVKDQHPDKDIRFVFSNPRNKIYKGSKTTYADWCDKHGFLWAKKVIPKQWLN